MFSHDGAMWFGGGFMWLFWILFIVVIVLVVKFVTGNNAGSSSDKNEESPMSILDKRYANGDINEDEYNRRKRELKK
jgi:putative membrane protein